MNNVHVALQCARLARDMLGANGITDEYQCGRHMCNLESRLHVRGNPRHPHAGIGEAITGIPAYK